MRCPFCKKDNDKVIDTRPSDDGSVIRRRRECLDCGKRYTTHERLEELPIRVIKKSGQRQSFNRDKILAGVMRALEKRPVSVEKADALVTRVERTALDRTDREITTREIGELVMAELRATDEVAYVRFASVYQEFQAMNEFINVIKSIHTGNKPE